MKLWTSISNFLVFVSFSVSLKVEKPTNVKPTRKLSGSHHTFFETKALEVQDNLLENGTDDDSGKVCIEKVMMTDETEYEEVMTCTHDIVERCHDTFVTTYEPHQEQECKENFKKTCNIVYEIAAINEEVEECRSEFVPDCQNDVERSKECKTVYETECTKRIKVHEVEDDVANCETINEENCYNITIGREVLK